MFDKIPEYVNLLNNGQTILYPTDTVWGIGCDATNTKAVEKIFQIKQRPSSKSMIILVDSKSMLKEYVESISPIAINLINTVVEPLTIIYSNPIKLAPNVLANDGSVAIRLVKNPFCQELIKQLGKPMVSTSANLSSDSTPENYHNISEVIKKSVDGIVNYRQNETMKFTPSKIVKINADGTTTRIR